MTRTRASRIRPLVLTVACALVLAGAVALGWPMARGLFDRQYNVTLADVMSTDSADAVDTTTDPMNVTEAKCGGELDCVEAFDTAEATYYRFSSRKSASAFADSLADGFRSNYIVMDFAGKANASKEHQLWAMQNLAGFWNDYEGDYPAR